MRRRGRARLEDAGGGWRRLEEAGGGAASARRDLRFILIFHKCLRFDEFDEAIEEAIEEDIKEAEGGGRRAPVAHCCCTTATWWILLALKMPFQYSS